MAGPSPTRSAVDVGPSALRRFVAPALFVAALFAAVWLRRPTPGDAVQLHAFRGQSMGTTWVVKVVAPPDQRGGVSRVEEVAAGALARVDAAMSTYKPDSELSRFNRHPPGEPFSASPGFLVVLREALRVHGASGGVFDVTVGPLVDAWGFGPERVSAPPDEAALLRLKASVGSHLLAVDDASVGRMADGVRVDLSAIAKGYAVDQVAEQLDALGIHRYMVEVGGEVRARGTNAEGAPWRVGIERPDVLTREAIRVVALADASMATSGDYRNYREHEGKRISHTIDPRTGRPITHALASVSVVHPSCMTADAWATALNVLGPDDGLAVATQHGLAATFLVRVAEGFEERSTPSFAALEAGALEIGARAVGDSGGAPDGAEP